MDFYEYFNQNDAPVVAFLNKVADYVLRSMKAGNGFVSFRFPPNYQQLIAPQQRPMAIAAHTVHDGEAVTEGIRSKEGGKGKVTYNSGVEAGTIQPFRAADRASQFQQTFDQKLPAIAKDMGLLFELDVFVALAGLQLETIGEVDVQEARRRRRAHIMTINRIVGETAFSTRITQMVANNANLVANQMIQRARSSRPLLNACEGRINKVLFLGGVGASGKQDFADIRIGCNEESMMGFALKFTTEAKTHYRSLSAVNLYTLMGGKNIEEFKRQVDQAKLAHGDGKKIILREIGSLAEQFEDNPEGFTSLLNAILTGKKHIVPVVRNYMRNTGGAGWSVAFQRDFDTTDDPDNPLIPLPNARVSVIVTNTYVKLLYKRQGGSRDGTYITIEPDMVSKSVDNWDFGGDDEFIPPPEDDWGGFGPPESVPVFTGSFNVKVNNLSTDRFNNNKPGRFANRPVKAR